VPKKEEKINRNLMTGFRVISTFGANLKILFILCKALCAFTLAEPTHSVMRKKIDGEHSRVSGCSRGQLTQHRDCHKQKPLIILYNNKALAAAVAPFINAK
jgi:hypothetical protein